jgi:hypothetical protein
VPCPKGIELEAGHIQLGDLKTLNIPSWFLHGMAELLDGGVVKLLKDIEAGDHLFVKEGSGRPLAEEENTLEHGNCGCADFFLDDRVFGVFGGFIVTRRIGLFTRAFAPLAPGLGWALRASYWAQNIITSAQVWMRSPPGLAIARGQTAVVRRPIIKSIVINQSRLIMRGRHARAVSRHGSTLPVFQQSGLAMGWINSKKMVMR